MTRPAWRANRRAIRLESLEERRLLTAVIDRLVFYNQSGFDGHDAAINLADDSAIATDKSAYLAEVQFTILPVVSTSTLDSEPNVRGGEIIWQGRGGTDGGNDDEIFYFNGTSVAQLTTNNVPDRFPEISALGIAWERGSGASQEIIFYDGSETPLTSNLEFDGNLTLGDDRLSWESRITVNMVTEFDIFTWTGSGSPTNLSNAPGIVDLRPYADGDQVVWIGGSVPSATVKRFDGTTTTTIGTSTLAIDDPRIDGSIAAWESFKGTTTNDREIYWYNGSLQAQLSDNAFPDFDPQVSGQNIVWWGGTFNNFHVFLWDGTEIRKISTGIRNQFPQIDGDYVVWQGFDGNDDEIFFWNGHKVTQLTNNSVNDTMARISGNHIAWISGSQLHHTYVTVAAATPASVTSYDRGLNGVMIDIAAPAGTLTLGDFQFRMSGQGLAANNAPGTWVDAPPPLDFQVRPGAGTSSSDRVVITWSEGAITDRWLEVIVAGNDQAGDFNTNTGLAASDIFYFGNKIGDTMLNHGGIFVANAADQVEARNNQGILSTVTNVFDFNRDRAVNATDQIVSRNNQGLLQTIRIGAQPAPGPLPLTLARDGSTQDRPLLETDAVAAALSVTTPERAGATVMALPPRAIDAVAGIVPRLLELADRAREAEPRVRARLAEVLAARGGALDDLLNELLARRRR